VRSEDVLRAHSGVGALQIQKRADQQSGARQQDEGERNLGDDQSVADGRPARAASE